MSAVEERSLSPDELRKKLHQTFKNRGVLDTLKTQLRNQLIQELQQPQLRDARPKAAPSRADSISLLASNSLVIDHLQSCGYEYTLSVFYPESSMSKDKIFSTKDLLHLMKISSHLPLYKSLVSNIQSGQKGLLVNLLSDLTDHHLRSELRDAETQTSSTEGRESLVQKMQMIDEEYDALKKHDTRWASVEAKLAEYRKEMEEHAQAELKTKLQHFQQVEEARVRAEEKEKWQREIQQVRRQLERDHEMKSEALMRREKNAIERLQKQQEMEEKEIYAQRQDLLKEMESVSSRETELRHKMEAFDKSCKLHEEKVRSTEELLRRRELAVKSVEETYDQKLSSEIRRHQLELKEDYSRRTENLLENENRIKEEMVCLQKEAAILESKKNNFEQTVSELKRVQAELETLRTQAVTLVQQNALLRDQLDQMRDYRDMRRERLELLAQVRILKEQLEENQKEKQRVLQELSRPSQEVLELRAKVMRLENDRIQDKEELENHKEVLHGQLKQEMERCVQLKVQMEECEERTGWMSKHAEELKLQLRHTQQALENEVLRNSKPTLIDRCGLFSPGESATLPDLSSARPGFDRHVCDPGLAPMGRPARSRLDTALPDAEMVMTEALERIRELERETETLEEAYRSYRKRAAKTATANSLVTEALPLRSSVGYVKPKAALQHRVTFVSEGPATPNYRPPQPRRLSSTPVSASKTRPWSQDYHGTEDGAGACVVDGPVLTFSGLASGRNVSPIPAASSRENTHSTPPGSPQINSATWQRRSPPQLQEMVSSSSQESSPQPEKISIQDLTEPLPDLTVISDHIRDRNGQFSQETVPKNWNWKDVQHSPPRSENLNTQHSPPHGQDLKDDQHSPHKENLRDVQHSPPRGENLNTQHSPPRGENREVAQHSPSGNEIFKDVHHSPRREEGFKDVQHGQQQQEESPYHAHSGTETIPLRKAGGDEEEEDHEEVRLLQEEWKRKEERRRGERLQAEERERRELERLEQELLQSEARNEKEDTPDRQQERSEGATEERDVVKDVDVEKAATATRKGSGEETQRDKMQDPDPADPLYKYMMMVMQQGKRQKEQNPKKEEEEEEEENQISDPVVLSSNKDDSTGITSNEEADFDW